MTAICAFLNDRSVEYLEEEFPKCCAEKYAENSDKESADVDAVLRALLAAVSHWAPKWCYAEAVNVLCQDWMLVK